MKNISIIGLLILSATAFAAFNTYKVELLKDSVIEGKTLKAGEYKMSVQNGTVTLKQGKQVIEVPAKQEAAQYKAESNEYIYKDGSNLSAINLAGTTTKIVFEAPGSAQSGM